MLGDLLAESSSPSRLLTVSCSLGFSRSLPLLESRPTIDGMEISFAPELEAKLNQIASQAGKAPDEVVRELVASCLDHDEWFRHEVGKGLASLDQGKTVSHEDVRRQMDRILGSR